jgi:hypothetical protein
VNMRRARAKLAKRGEFMASSANWFRGGMLSRKSGAATRKSGAGSGRF